MYKKIISISTLSILLFCILSPSNAEASYFPSSSDLKYDQVELKTSGEVRLKIDSVGHVGIGTLQPTDNFHVQSDKTPSVGTISNVELSIAVTGSGEDDFTAILQIGDEIISGDGQARTVTSINSSTEIMVGYPFYPALTNESFEYSRPRLIVEQDGDTTIQGNLTVTGTSYLGNVEISAEEIKTDNIVTTAVDKFLRFFTANVEQVTISDTGYFGIGDITPGAHLVIGDDTNMGFVNGIGDVYIQNDLEVDGTTTVSGNIVSDTDSTDTLGTTDVRFVDTYSDTFTGNKISLDGANEENIIEITDDITDGLSITDGTNDIMILDTSGNNALSITPNTSIEGIVDLNNITDSSSATTGALAVDGGVGIAKNLNVGDNMGVTNDITFLDTDIDHSIGANLGDHILNMGGSDSEIYIPGDLTVMGTSSAVNTENLYVKEHQITINNAGTTTTSTGAGILIEGGATAESTDIVGYMKVDETVNSLLTFKAPGNAGIFNLDINGNQTLYMNANGFGIGIAEPLNKLDIEGGAVIGAAYSGTNTAPSNGLLIEGNVGIGVTSTTNKLEVSGNTKITGDLEVTGTSTLNNVVITTDSISSEENKDLDIRTWVSADSSAKDRLTITAAGDVGIGTVTPLGRLHTEDIQYDVGTGLCPTGYTEGDYDGEADTADCKAVGIIAEANGYVGLGDTDPTAHLVVGDDTNASYANGGGDVYIQNDLEIDGITTVSDDIISDTDSTDTLGVTGTRFLNTFTDTLTGNVIDLDGALTGDNVIEVSDDQTAGLTVKVKDDIELMVFKTTNGAETLSINPDTYIDGNLSVTGTSFLGDVEITSEQIKFDNAYNTTPNSDMTFFTAGTERVTIQDGGNMGVGDTDPGAHFVVGDDTTRGYADGTGDVYVQNDLEVDGDITTGGTIKSDTDSTDTLGLTGTRFLNTFTDTLTGNVIDLDSASTAGNEIQISDDQDDGLSIKINGGSDLMVFDTSNTGESLSITPNTSIAGTLDVTGATTIAGATTVTNVTSSTNTSSGAVVVTGGAGIGENLNVGGTTTIAGITTINDTTTSSSTSTGALVIAGGVGIAEDLYIDDNIDFTEGAHSIGAGIGANTLTLGGDTSTVVVEGDLRVDGTATVENTFDLDVINKVINVNIEGDTISSAGAGLIVKGGTAGEEIVGYMKVAADNSDLEFKASTGNILTLDIDADSTVLVTNDAMLNQDVRTSANPQFDGGILIDTNTLYVNAATDRVGINTLDPVSALEIDGTDALRIPAGTDAERPTTTRQGQIRYNTDSEGFEGYSGTAWGTLGGSIDIDKDTQIQVEESADEDMIRFDTAGAERMIIDNTGNIGINTSLPEDKFQIQGDLIPGAEFIAALDPGNLDILSSSQPEFDDSFIGKQIIIPDVDDLTRIIVAVLDVDIIQVGTPLPFPVAFEDNLPFFHSEMEFLVEADGDTFVNGDLTVTGILGLSGNTTIDGDLEVTGTSTLNNVKITTDSISGEIDNSLNIKTEETGGGGAQDRITITKSGYVGVGDTTPAAHLVIGDDTNATVAGVGDVYIQNNLEVDGTITTSGNIVSDTDSTDTLGLTGTRFANTFTDTLTGNVIDLDGATAVNEIQITNGVADGLSITDGDTDFMVFTTTDGSEALSVNGNVDMNDTTESTSTNTGALVVDGGAGIAKDVNIGGSLDIAGGILLNIVKKTTDYTATLDDYVVLCDSTTADVAITLPLASSTEGLELTLKKIDSSTNACSVLPNGAELIDGSNSSISFYTQYTSYTVISDGTEWWVK